VVAEATAKKPAKAAAPVETDDAETEAAETESDGE